MDISKWDLKELKALAYDLSRQIRGLNADLQTVNRTISDKETPNVQQTVPDSDSSDVPSGSDSVCCNEGCAEGDVLPPECATES
jgi:hypothetical protein